MIKYTVDNNVAVITWAMTSAPMNVLNDESIPQFEDALRNAYADESVKGIIITSGKPEFVAGADLKMILRNNDKGHTEMLKVSTELNRVFRSIETSGKPAVAAINGTALGGGYEICLACHYRLAIANPKTVLGLVEVTLGLLPGAGGTQRLPRMIGIQAALPLLLEGKKVGVQEAKTLGLIDDIADTPEQMMEKARAWILANPTPLKPWDERDRKTGRIVGTDTFKVPGGNVQSPVGAQTFATGAAMLMDKTKGNYPAPLEIMACVYEGLQVNIDRALVIEARHFVKLATSKVAKNLIQTMFLGMNEVNKGISRPKDQPKTDVTKIGILGAGTIGAGIAYVSAQAGIDVVLNDVTVEAAEQGKDYVRALLKKGVERGQIDPLKADDILNRIKPTADSADRQGCDLILGAAPSQFDRKAQVTQEAGSQLAEGVVFALYTATEPISNPAKSVARPENFIGIHFVAPVDKTMLVEIIRGEQTSDYALAVLIDYVRKLKKTPIVVNDSRGFYVTRCLNAYANEGQELLSEGVSPVLIENAGKAAGMPTGPLATLDEYALTSNMKTKAESTKADSSDSHELALGDVKMRLLYRQAIEAVRCFDEGVVRTKPEGDLGSILGWGFPAYTGGALSFVDFVGVNTFVQTLDRLADQYGERFRPTETLQERTGAQATV